MTLTDLAGHYDATRHVRFTQPLGDEWVCEECVEIQAAHLSEVMSGGGFVD